MTDSMDNRMDDGSLAFLQIPRDENSRSFNCEATSQSKLVNTTFWVFDIIEDVETRWSRDKNGAGRMLVKIKPEKDSPETDAKKFFTGSQDVQYVLRMARMGEV